MSAHPAADPMPGASPMSAFLALHFPGRGAGERALEGFIYQHLYVLRLMRRLLARDLDGYVCERGGDFLAFRQSPVGAINYIEIIEIKSRLSGKLAAADAREALTKLASTATIFRCGYPNAELVCRLVVSPLSSGDKTPPQQLAEWVQGCSWPADCRLEWEQFVTAHPSISEMQAEIDQLLVEVPLARSALGSARTVERFIAHILVLTIPFNDQRWAVSIEALARHPTLQLGQSSQERAAVIETVEEAIRRVIEISGHQRGRDPSRPREWRRKVLPGLPAEVDSAAGWWVLGPTLEACRRLDPLLDLPNTESSVAALEKVQCNETMVAAKFEIKKLTPHEQFLAEGVPHRNRIELVLSFLRALRRWLNAGVVIEPDFARHQSQWYVRREPDVAFVLVGAAGLAADAEDGIRLPRMWLLSETILTTIRMLYFGPAGAVDRQDFLARQVESFLQTIEAWSPFIHIDRLRSEFDEHFEAEINRWPIFITETDSQFLRDCVNAGQTFPAEALSRLLPIGWRNASGVDHPEIIYVRCRVDRSRDQVQIGLVPKIDGTLMAYRYLRYGTERWESKRDGDEAAEAAITIPGARKAALVPILGSDRVEEVAWEVFALGWQEVTSWLTDALTELRARTGREVEMPPALQAVRSVHELRQAPVGFLRERRFGFSNSEDGEALQLDEDGDQLHDHLNKAGIPIKAISELRLEAEDEMARRRSGVAGRPRQEVGGRWSLPVNLDTGELLGERASFRMVDYGSEAILRTEESLLNELEQSFLRPGFEVPPVRHAWDLIQRMTNHGAVPRRSRTLWSGTFRRPLESNDSPSAGHIAQKILRALVPATPWCVLTGAPGTGKTTVAAQVVADYLEEHRGRLYPPVRVLIAANTHWAIENFLRTFREDQRRAHWLIKRSVTSAAGERLAGQSEQWRSTIERHERDFRAATNDMLPTFSADRFESGDPGAQRAALEERLAMVSRAEAAAAAEEEVCLVPSHVTWAADHGRPPRGFKKDLARTASLLAETLAAFTEIDAVENAPRGQAEVAEIDAYAAQIVTATVDGLGKLPDMSFDLVVFEEASQLTIPGLLKVLTQTMRGNGGRSNDAPLMLFSGDPQQLPPFLAQPSECAEHLVDIYAEAKESLSVMELISAHHPDRVFALDYQRRMHPSIAALVSNLFYAHQQWTCPPAGRTDGHVIWMDSGYKGRAGQREENSNSMFQDVEIQIVRHLVQQHRPGDGSLLIVSPYAAQCQRLSDEFGSKINCSTVDACQGIEADTVLFSFVAMGDFALNPARLNVALSRARRRLILIGNIFALHEAATQRSQAPRAGERWGHVAGLAALFGSGGIYAEHVKKWPRIAKTL